MLRVLLFLLLCFWGFIPNSLQARSVVAPKRETALLYYLILTNLSSNETLTFESENAEFELPDNLEGDYSLQISFEDKWGRKIESEESKIIKLINKRKVEEVQIAQEEISPPLVGLIFTPYSSSGPIEADQNTQVVAKKKFQGSLAGKGIKTIVKVFTLPKWESEIDFSRSSDAKSSFQSTEAGLSYRWYESEVERINLSLSSGGTYVSSRVTDKFQDTSGEVTSSVDAVSVYAFTKARIMISFEKFNSETMGVLGLSESYIRYTLGQSLMVPFKRLYALGPWLEYSKFENGTKQGSIKANMLKIGLNFNLNL